MRRRRYLALAGSTLALAGCSQLSNLTGPTYDPELTDDEMTPGEDAMPGYWRRYGGNEGEDAPEEGIAFINREDTKYVLLHGTAAESAKEAKETLSKMSNRYDSHEYELEGTDESMWAKQEQFAISVFRDDNAVGFVAGGRRSGLSFVADQNLAIEYSGTMVDYWQTL